MVIVEFPIVNHGNYSLISIRIWVIVLWVLH
jgi:DNA polymerase I